MVDYLKILDDWERSRGKESSEAVTNYELSTLDDAEIWRLLRAQHPEIDPDGWEMRRVDGGVWARRRDRETWRPGLFAVLIPWERLTEDKEVEIRL